MFAKILAFVLLGIGMLVTLSFIAVAVPSLHNQATVIGEHVISWFKVVAAGGLAVVFWLSSKV